MRFDLPPLDPTNRAYQESVMRARAAQIRERLAAGLCPECGHLADPVYGCFNESECFQAQIDAKRREKAGAQ